MTYPISACCFIRNNSAGFCLWESMASILPFVSEFVILDLLSDDGTWEILQDISEHNPKVKIWRKPWPKIDAGVFADLANDLIGMCHYDKVWYFQADEVPHENLFPLIRQRFDRGEFDLSFWRVQFANNFAFIKWFPHLVHRIGIKGKFNFVGDGMNTDRTWDARICSSYGGEMFPQWGSLGQEGIKPYINEMITDVGLLGCFRDNIPERRGLHAPFWHEEPTVPYYDKATGQQTHKPASEWQQIALSDPDWTRTESPYNIPAVLRYHIGKVRYEVRPDLIQAIREDRTADYLDGLGGWK